MPRVVVVGSINMDLVVRAERLPRPGETVRGTEFHTIPGGKGANQAVAAARLGAEARMVGRVGDDDFGERLRQGLADNGVAVDDVVADREHPTGVALIVVQESGENSIVVAGGANGAVTAKDVAAAKDAVSSADVLLLQLEIPLDTVAAALDAASAANVASILDAGPAAKLPDAVRNAANVLSPNLGEAEVLLGRPVSDALDAAQALVAAGAPACVVKSGAQGCAWAVPGQSEHLPAVAVDVVDTTAAGDAFTAALGVALAEGKPLADAARWASFAGALAVTRLGAQPSMPTRQELEDFISRRG
ncbi:MAG: ribokinase [Armatimonadota bacterium]|nr:MAG: ribokinase [Armatimonadota bacterium]